MLKFLKRNWISASVILLAILWYSFGNPTPYSTSDAVISPINRTVTILAAGDVNMGRKIGQEILKGNIDYPFVNIADTLKDADITFVNLESQLADLGGETQSPTNEFRFAGPPEAAKTLKNAGVDIVSVANNHMWDYGQARLGETLDALDSQGVLHIGAAKDGSQRFASQIMDAGNTRIAFLGITTLLNGYENVGADEYVAYVYKNGETNQFDISPVVSEIARLREQENTDFVIVSIHTGTEYQTQPNADMVDMSRRLIDAGADVILGHHPHVPQPVEEYTSDQVAKLPSGQKSVHKGVIFYSLGNFAFWQPFSFWTQHSYMAKLTLQKGKPIEYDIIPVRSGWQPSVETDADAITRIMDLLDDQVIK